MYQLADSACSLGVEIKPRRLFKYREQNANTWDSWRGITTKIVLLDSGKILYRYYECHYAKVCQKATGIAEGA